eukprot:Clim_evm3s83 gene=Clim_evmTU3s83
MKFNIAYPANGTQKLIDIDDERRCRAVYDKRMGQEMEADFLGEEFKGYILRVSGGNDKQGFCMKQGVLTNQRVRLFMGAGHSCYRPRRKGERRRKSVRGCIVDQLMSVVNLVVVKKGEQEVPGLTDRNIPRRRGPKRANNIRKLFNLSKEDDVRKYVIRRNLDDKDGKKRGSKSAKIQRIITPQRLQRKRRARALKEKRREASREQAADYKALLATRAREARERRRSLSRRRSASQSSTQA